jgi:hypothetical protein
VGWVLEWIIKILNEGVFLVEKLPFSVLDNVYISKLQCVLLILLVVLIYVWIDTKKLTPLIIASSLCILFSLDQWIHLERDVNQNRVTFYSIPGHTAIDFIESGSTYFVADSTIGEDASMIKFHVLPARLHAGVRTVNQGNALRRELTGCALMIWNGKTILQINDPSFLIPANLEVDFLVISNNAVKSVADLVKAKEIIIDSSNSFKLAGRLLEESRSLDIRATSLLHHGAYTKFF